VAACRASGSTARSRGDSRVGPRRGRPGFLAVAARVGMPLILLCVMLTPWVWKHLGRAPDSGERRAVSGWPAEGSRSPVAFWLSWPRPADTGGGEECAAHRVRHRAPGGNGLGRLRRNKAGTRFSPASRITPERVGLKVAWTYRTGDLPQNHGTAVPADVRGDAAQVGDTLYLCTPRDIVVALDATRPGAVAARSRNRRDRRLHADLPWCCYHQSSDPKRRTARAASWCRPSMADDRAERANGQRCPRFGRDGEISLRAGLGRVEGGSHFATSPRHRRNAAIVGSFVLDNMAVDAPSVSSGRSMW